MSGHTPIIAIVGRPNVGKSTLFNRLLKQRKAIVHEQPGLTRDRHYGHAEYRNRPFVVIDTGGYEDTAKSPLLELMRQQTLIAIDEADTILFVTEESITSDPIDAEILQRLRASRKPFFLVVNKADNNRTATQAISDFSIHGLDRVYPVSALHGEGIYDLMDDVTAGFDVPPEEEEAAARGPIRVAIVGRQNVGKSTLTNRLLGENRMIASDIPGTTRDAIDTSIENEGREYTLIDTAGIRRRGKIERGPEMLSVHSSFSAIDRAEVAVLLLDATTGIVAQDTHIAGYVLEAGKACILVLNKWDAIANREDYGQYIKNIREDFKFLKWAPILTISAKTGQRAHKLWDLIAKCAEQFRRDFTTRELNEILSRATAHLSPPVTGNKQISLKYVTQTGHSPPALTFFVNDPKLMHFSYERYLQNQFRTQLSLEGTPLRFRLQRKSRDLEEREPAPRPPFGARVEEIGAVEDFEAGVYEESD
ncbi:ribosome biogenesis GTPase Der [Candidatus Poribacteria bacterium]|nr:ribosome biogenesis GTPase Der [Candidatus Poribacteria bacterium]